MPYDMVCLNQSHRKQCITYINNMFLRYGDAANLLI